MAELNIASTGGGVHRHPLDKPRTTIGRSRESDIFLADQWLSRHHAEVQQRNGGWVLLDLGSKNGTLLNGERISGECRLRHGDVISLGEHHLTFLTGEEPQDEAPEGTRIFSARILSDIQTKPAADPEDLRRQNRILGALSEAAKTLLFFHRPLPELFEKILDMLFEAVPAQRAAIVLLEGTPPQPVVKASRSRLGKPITSVSRSIARKVLEDLKSLLIPNILEDAAFRAQDSILATGIRSAMCAPLWFTAAESEKDAVIGLVYLDSLMGAHSFEEEDLGIVTALANVAAAKIENVRLIEESLEKRRMEEDMRVAAEIQRGLLPGDPPEVPGYELVGANFPCRTVGGDYYDFAVDGDHLLLALGDVSGKGTGAALLMTMLRAAVRAHWGEPVTAEGVSRINNTVAQNVPPNKYITFFMGRVNIPTGEVTYVNAGHNPPLLVRGGGDVRGLEEGGMVLGFFEEVTYAQGRVVLEPGDVLVIYSDGVTETWNDQDEEFGETRLSELVVENRHKGAQALQDTLLQELETFSSGTRATDDRTLIVLKRC